MIAAAMLGSSAAAMLGSSAAGERSLHLQEEVRGIVAREGGRDFGSCTTAKTS